MSADLTFIANEQGRHLRDRFGVLLGNHARFFGCLAGCFFISGFHGLHPALAKTEHLLPLKVLAVLRRAARSRQPGARAPRSHPVILVNHRSDQSV